MLSEIVSSMKLPGFVAVIMKPTRSVNIEIQLNTKHASLYKNRRKLGADIVD